MEVGTRFNGPYEEAFGCVYVLRCPVTDAVRYVGSSVNPLDRYKGHYSDAKKTFRRSPSRLSPLQCWLIAMLDGGAYPILEIVAIGDQDDMRVEERLLHDQLRECGSPLLNAKVPHTKPMRGSMSTKSLTPERP